MEANEKGAAPFTDEEVISFRKTLEGEGFDPVKTAQQLAARSPIRIEGKNILSTAWGKRTVSYEIGIKPGLDQLQEGGAALEADNIREAVLRIGEKYCAIYDVLDRGPLEETLCVVAAGGSLQLAALTELLEEEVDPALYLIDQRSGQGAQIRVWSDYSVVHEKASQGVYGLSREEAGEGLRSDREHGRLRQAQADLLAKGAQPLRCFKSNHPPRLAIHGLGWEHNEFWRPYLHRHFLQHGLALPPSPPAKGRYRAPRQSRQCQQLGHKKPGSAKGEIEWMQNGRFRMGSSSSGFSSKDSLKTLLPSSPL